MAHCQQPLATPAGRRGDPQPQVRRGRHDPPCCLSVWQKCEQRGLLGRRGVMSHSGTAESVGGPRFAGSQGETTRSCPQQEYIDDNKGQYLRSFADRCTISAGSDGRCFTSAAGHSTGSTLAGRETERLVYRQRAPYNRLTTSRLEANRSLCTLKRCALVPAQDA